MHKSTTRGNKVFINVSRVVSFNIFKQFLLIVDRGNKNQKMLKQNVTRVRKIQIIAQLNYLKLIHILN